VFSIFMPRLREGRAAAPKPMTGGRQAVLVALIVIIGGYPLARWGADALFARFAESTALSIVADPAILAAIRAQNMSLAPQDQAAIDQLDRLWIEERKNPAGSLTSEMLARPASALLRNHIDSSLGTVTHAILMDEKGRNIAIAAPTTDYWQGDEAKFLETAARASTAIDRGLVERRHDGKGAACWISRTVFDNGKPIGALAVELSLDRVNADQCGKESG
jgi:hypothetical protein